MLALILIMVKCGYDSARKPELVKSDLLRLYPEIQCQNAEITIDQSNDAVYSVIVHGDGLCTTSLRSALVSRRYRRGSTLSDFRMRDGYSSSEVGDPMIMFDFDPDGRTVKWIRIWS